MLTVYAWLPVYVFVLVLSVKINHRYCTLPTAASHWLDCSAECLQHLPLHSITSGAVSRIQWRGHSSMKQANAVVRSKWPVVWLCQHCPNSARATQSDSMPCDNWTSCSCHHLTVHKLHI